MALPMQKAVTDKFEHMFLVKEANEQWRSGVEAQLTGAWDYERRLEVLDGDGIAGEIVFPDGITEQNAPPFGAGLALPTEGIMPELQWAGARAHNRWLAELCARDPVRHSAWRSVRCCGISTGPWRKCVSAPTTGWAAC